MPNSSSDFSLNSSSYSGNPLQISLRIPVGPEMVLWFFRAFVVGILQEVLLEFFKQFLLEILQEDSQEQKLQKYHLEVLENSQQEYMEKSW